MDTAELIIKYTEADFADAIRSLLPKGDYWQETENPLLTNTIEGMATDFKATHDDIELSLLTDFQPKLFGWKLSDYEALLFDIVGENSCVVFDNQTTPNLIYVSLADAHRQSSLKAWQAFENNRLPHTEIAWIYNSKVEYHHQIANYRHIRNLHKHEVIQ